jgi:hypothetical protein
MFFVFIRLKAIGLRTPEVLKTYGTALISDILGLCTSGKQVPCFAVVTHSSVTAPQLGEINSLKLNLADLRARLETVRDKY